MQDSLFQLLLQGSNPHHLSTPAVASAIQLRHPEDSAHHVVDHAPTPSTLSSTSQPQSVNHHTRTPHTLFTLEPRSHGACTHRWILPATYLETLGAQQQTYASLQPSLKVRSTTSANPCHPCHSRYTADLGQPGKPTRWFSCKLLPACLKSSAWAPTLEQGPGQPANSRQKSSRRHCHWLSLL